MAEKMIVVCKILWENQGTMCSEPRCGRTFRKAISEDLKCQDYPPKNE